MIRTKLHIIFLFVGFVIGNYAYCQTFTFIYIDKSNTTNLDSLRKDAAQLINNTSGDKLLFISNDKTPLILTSDIDAIEALDQLGYIRPNTPNAFFEVDTLNNLLTNYLDNYKTFNFHFFIDPAQAISKKQVIFLIERLLLCNNLLYKSNVKIGLHLEETELNKKNNLDYFLVIFDENKQYQPYEY
jgi:hypothetical protein